MTKVKKTIIFLVLLTVSFCLYASVYAQPTPTPNPPASVIWENWTSLVGRWAFDEGEGLTAYDSAGSNNGTFTKLTEIAWTSSTSKFGDSLCFNNQTAEYIDCGADSVFDQQTDFTVVAWVYYNSNIDSTGIVGRYEGFDTGGWFLTRLSNQSMKFQYVTTESGGTTDDIRGVTIPLNQWVFTALVWHTDHAKIWSNANSDTGAHTGYPLQINGGTPFVIGLLTPAFYSPDGYIDEVNFFNRALTDSEISQIRNNATPTPTPVGYKTPTPAPTPIPPEVTMKVLPFQYSGILDMGSDPSFVLGEIKYIYSKISERDSLEWTWDTSTYWIQESNSVYDVSEASASRLESDRLYALADSFSWAEASSPYYMFFRWGITESSNESYITPIGINLADETIDNWNYAGTNLSFYIGEKKNVWINGVETNDNNFTLQSSTYWINDVFGATYAAETDAGLIISGFRIYGLVDSTGWSTLSDPYSIHVRWHLWETPQETFETVVLMDAELLAWTPTPSPVPTATPSPSPTPTP